MHAPTHNFNYAFSVQFLDILFSDCHTNKRHMFMRPCIVVITRANSVKITLNIVTSGPTLSWYVPVSNVYPFWSRSAHRKVPNFFPVDWWRKLTRWDRLYTKPFPCCPLVSLQPAWQCQDSQASASKSAVLVRRNIQMLCFSITLHCYCCLLYMCVNTFLNATLIFIFHVSYYNMFLPQSAIIKCIRSCKNCCTVILVCRVWIRYF
jgi:hypothetical protein